MDRRPIKSRNTAWAKAAARFLARRGVHPNAISIAGMGFALCAGLCLTVLHLEPDATRRAVLLVLGALCIQSRLLCNMLDGMVAMERGLCSPAGALFNEIPDRISDTLILVGAGYAGGLSGAGPVVGWGASVLAVLTAYVRALGGSIGAPQPFVGPMAKSHRMAALTAAALLSILECGDVFRGRVLAWTLVLVILGMLVTIGRRIHLILGALQHVD
jgi:phosphatidylglycerophosphate synthase